MNTKPRVTGWAVLTILLALLSGCSGPIVEVLPDTDIVFQSMWTGTRANTLGFVDADGSNLTYVQVGCCRDGLPAFPAWTPDGDYLIFRAIRVVWHGGDLYAIGPDRRLISYPTEVACCGGGAAITEDGRHFVINADPYGVKHLHLVAIESGEIKETLITEPRQQAGVGIGTRAVHESRLVYRHRELIGDQTTSSLIVRDLDSGQEIVLATAYFIEKPALSPDGRSVAYTVANGIYVVPVTGGASRRIVGTAVLRSFLGYPVAVPAASWSPDGEWLVYHRCTLPGQQYCGGLADYSIFKVNVETGEEILLVEQGLYPYWRAKGD
jgi:hypothetical protein